MLVETHFSGLSKRQTMMLLTGLTFGGQDASGLFDFLLPEEAELLKHRAASVMEIPREKRLPLLVQEMKRLVTNKGGTLWQADPDRLASLLRQERHALIEVLVRALPVTLADGVRERLPINPVDLTREVKGEVLEVVRAKLEEILARQPSTRPPFKISDVLLLKTRELMTLCDRLGAMALGTAIASLPEANREEFLQALPPDQRRIAKQAGDSSGRKISEREATEQIGFYRGDKTPFEAIRSAGAQRLARACVALLPDYGSRVLEKHRGEFGNVLAKWAREERGKSVGQAEPIRAEILTELERLEGEGLVERPVRLRPPTSSLSFSRSSSGSLPGGKVLPPVPRELKGLPPAPAPRPPERKASRMMPAVSAPPRPAADRVPLKREPPRDADARIRRAGVAPRRPAQAPGAESSRTAPAPQRRASGRQNPRILRASEETDKSVDPSIDPRHRPGGGRGGRGRSG
jgi:hypothetical protein